MPPELARRLRPYAAAVDARTPESPSDGSDLESAASDQESDSGASDGALSASSSVYLDVRSPRAAFESLNRGLISRP